jgi:sodium-coupled neutral amino acid transporter 11
LIDFPLTVPLKVTTLTKFSSMTLVSLSFMVLCILFEAPGKIASRPAEATVEAFADLDKTPAVACLSVFALMWHTNCVGVARELDNPTAKRCAVVSVGGTAFVTFLYALIAVGGYLSFGSGVRSDIVSMYTDDPFFLVVRCFITCSLLVTIPVNMFPLRESVFVMLKSMSPSLEMTFPVRILMSAVILGGAVVMAIVYPDITRIMQLLGGSLATLLMIVFPAIIGRLVLPFSTWVVSMVSAGLFAAFLIPAAVGLIGKPL